MPGRHRLPVIAEQLAGQPQDLPPLQVVRFMLQPSCQGLGFLGQQLLPLRRSQPGGLVQILDRRLIRRTRAATARQILGIESQGIRRLVDALAQGSPPGRIRTGLVLQLDPLIQRLMQLAVLRIGQRQVVAGAGFGRVLAERRLERRQRRLRHLPRCRHDLRLAIGRLYRRAIGAVVDRRFVGRDRVGELSLQDIGAGQALPERRIRRRRLQLLFDFLGLLRERRIGR